MATSTAARWVMPNGQVFDLTPYLDVQCQHGCPPLTGLLAKVCCSRAHPVNLFRLVHS